MARIEVNGVYYNTDEDPKLQWCAKLKRGFTEGQEHYIQNLTAMYYGLQPLGFTLEAMAGMAGSIMRESGFNPWRWGGDTGDFESGYGLFMFTPGEGYLYNQTAASIEWFAPSFYVTHLSDRGQPYDGYAQLLTFYNDYLGKWSRTGWKNNWSTSTYATEYARRQEILDTWGYDYSETVRRLAIDGFKQIDDLTLATQAFVLWYERPTTPTITIRLSYAQTAYEYLKVIDAQAKGYRRSGMPVWMMIRYRLF